MWKILLRMRVLTVCYKFKNLYQFDNFQTMKSNNAIEIQYFHKK